eukprot:264777-Rhodomonas_salina.1
MLWSWARSMKCYGVSTRSMKCCGVWTRNAWAHSMHCSRDFRARSFDTSLLPVSLSAWTVSLSPRV